MNKSQKRTTDDILIFGATNETVIKAIETIGKENNVELVRLEDKVLEDYIKRQSKAENKPATVEEFINNPENKKAAESKAFYLWNLITNNAKTEQSINRIFTKSEIVKKTTLTNKTLGELLQMLHLFGFIVFEKGNYEFRFVFTEELRKSESYADIVEAVAILNVEISRYLSLQGEEDRSKAVEELKNNLKELIKI